MWLTCFLVLDFPVLNLIYRAMSSLRPTVIEEGEGEEGRERRGRVRKGERGREGRRRKGRRKRYNYVVDTLYQHRVVWVEQPVQLPQGTLLSLSSPSSPSHTLPGIPVSSEHTHAHTHTHTQGHKAVGC